MNRVREAFRWLFVSRSTGRVTVAQWPNPPLWLYIVSAAAALILHPGGAAGSLLTWVGRGALLAWAGLEVGWGVNPFRRILGGVVLAAGAVTVLHASGVP